MEHITDSNRELTLDDFISCSNESSKNDYYTNGPKVEKFRQQGEYGQRKRIKP
jgi:hypothetical protein